MPGAPFLTISDSYQGASAVDPAPVTGSLGAGGHTMFLVWLVVIGVVIPALVLGGLRAGGFQFVFRRR